MSYCRWSSDNFKCDVYAYGSDAGFQIHVAGLRVLGEIPPLGNILELSTEEFLDTYKLHHAFLETAERKPIGLEYDGQSFTCGTLVEFFEKMQELRRLGYKIPEYVFESIREELVDAL